MARPVIAARAQPAAWRAGLAVSRVGGAQNTRTTTAAARTSGTSRTPPEGPAERLRRTFAPYWAGRGSAAGQAALPRGSRLVRQVVVGEDTGLVTGGQLTVEV